MSNIVTIGYSTEGSTDERFLKAIIEKTFLKIARDCEGLIEVFEPAHIPLIKKLNFTNNIVRLANEAYKRGILVLCIHADADSFNDEKVITQKISPALSALENEGSDTCKNIVTIIPVRMSEAWMLADKELLKEEINTTLSDVDLRINVHPEAAANPKDIITEALRIAQEHLPQRRKKVLISDLYQSIGQEISLSKLEELNSFKKFITEVKNAFIKLNYLH